MDMEQAYFHEQALQQTLRMEALRSRAKLWASAHKPLPEQGEGFVLLAEQGEEGAALQAALSETPGDAGELESLAERLLMFAARMGADVYQPGGSPAFQFAIGAWKGSTKAIRLAHLDGAWMNVSDAHARAAEVRVFYAHSRRDSVEQTMPDGGVKKVAMFRHLGWVEMT